MDEQRPRESGAIPAMARGRQCAGGSKVYRLKADLALPTTFDGHAVSPGPTEAVVQAQKVHVNQGRTAK